MQAILSFFVGWAYDHFAVGTDFTEGQPKEWFDWILTGKSKKGPALNLNYPLKNPKNNGREHNESFFGSLGKVKTMKIN